MVANLGRIEPVEVLLSGSSVYLIPIPRNVPTGDPAY
jgi:hypothetical protein